MSQLMLKKKKSIFDVQNKLALQYVGRSMPKNHSLPLVLVLLASKVLLDYVRPTITIHPTNPIRASNRHIALNELNRPEIDLSRPPMTTNDYQ